MKCVLVSSFPCKTIIHLKMQVAWRGLEAWDPKVSVYHSWMLMFAACEIPFCFMFKVCENAAGLQKNGRRFGVTHASKKCSTNRWCVVSCLLSVQVHQGCFQLPKTEPVLVRVCYNGLGPVTSVIMLQHKVMAADKWQHNEPRDHVTLPVHLDHHQ